jgi:ribosomal protein S18 acetylase RimI-like enzyme
LTPRSVQRCLEALRRLGFREAITAAIAPNESAGFFAAGFTITEHLHLLERSVGPADRGTVTIPAGIELRRGTKRDIPELLEVDSRCFGAFWRLDAAGVQDARPATAYARFRVAVRDETLVGYAITGRQGRVGYLQRLAVDPSARRTGLGTALVLDGVRWLARRHARSELVNTQESNTTALALYESLQFRLKPEGLQVLSAPLTP